MLSIRLNAHYWTPCQYAVSYNRPYTKLSALQKGMNYFLGNRSAVTRITDSAGQLYRPNIRHSADASRIPNHVFGNKLCTICKRCSEVSLLMSVMKIKLNINVVTQLSKRSTSKRYWLIGNHMSKKTPVTNLSYDMVYFMNKVYLMHNCNYV